MFISDLGNSHVKKTLPAWSQQLHLQLLLMVESAVITWHTSVHNWSDDNWTTSSPTMINSKTSQKLVSVPWVFWWLWWIVRKAPEHKKVGHGSKPHHPTVTMSQTLSYASCCLRFSAKEELCFNVWIEMHYVRKSLSFKRTHSRIWADAAGKVGQKVERGWEQLKSTSVIHRQEKSLIG